jgi:hypothetical protein
MCRASVPSLLTLCLSICMHQSVSARLFPITKRVFRLLALRPGLLLSLPRRHDLLAVSDRSRVLPWAGVVQVLRFLCFPRNS